MSDFNKGRHPLSPRSNSKVVPPYIPPPRKESLEAENARLKAECQARQAENSVLAVECDSLKSEVERLTKAGDAMASGLQGMAGERPKALADEWNDAKKGGQS